MEDRTGAVGARPSGRSGAAAFQNMREAVSKTRLPRRHSVSVELTDQTLEGEKPCPSAPPGAR